MVSEFGWKGPSRFGWSVPYRVNPNPGGRVCTFIGIPPDATKPQNTTMVHGHVHQRSWGPESKGRAQPVRFPSIITLLALPCLQVTLLARFLDPLTEACRLSHYLPISTFVFVWYAP